jgi:Holliday junction resolvasome RuvABC endonuclease subunit
MGILKAAISLKQKNLSDARIMAIDSSSKSIALSIFDRKGGVATLIEVAKINFPDRMEDKLASINSHLPNIFEKYGPIDNVIIEQTIYIQSPQTSRIQLYSWTYMGKVS